MTSEPSQQSQPAPVNDEGCYLIYESDSSGKLMLHYSKGSVPGAVGFWAAGEGKKIQGFKFKTNGGRSELIRNCAAGTAGRKNYFIGWCQFVKGAKAFKGSVRKMPEQTGSLEVDVYVFFKEGSGGTMTKLEDYTPLNVSDIDAVGCLPKESDIFEGLASMDFTTFLNKCDTVGAGTAC